MQRRGCSDLGHPCPTARWSGDLSASHGLRGPFDLKCLDELIEESRYSVGELRIGHLGRQPFSDLEPAPLDQVDSVGRKEFV